MIHVSPRSRLDTTLAACGAERLVTLLTEGHDFSRPDIIQAPNFLLLTMHDIVEERDGMTAPATHHVEALLAFAEANGPKRPLASTLCGISRSTAASNIAPAHWHPPATRRNWQQPCGALALPRRRTSGSSRSLTTFWAAAAE